MNLISMSSFSIWTLKKWCLLSRCLILLWKIEFLATKMALMLSHTRGTLSKVTPKTLMVCTIHRIWEQQLYTQPLWWIGQLKIVFKKTNKQEKIQKNNKYQKCSFIQSHNPQNHHQKNQQDPTKKKQNTKLECVFEIPEDSLNCHPM
jgi:hypothetical protein